MYALVLIAAGLAGEPVGTFPNAAACNAALIEKIANSDADWQCKRTDGKRDPIADHVDIVYGYGLRQPDLYIRYDGLVAK